jgi:hypothetical protein
MRARTGGLRVEGGLCAPTHTLKRDRGRSPTTDATASHNARSPRTTSTCGTAARLPGSRRAFRTPWRSPRCPITPVRPERPAHMGRPARLPSSRELTRASCASPPAILRSLCAHEALAWVQALADTRFARKSRIANAMYAARPMLGAVRQAECSSKCDATPGG